MLPRRLGHIFLRKLGFVALSGLQNLVCIISGSWDIRKTTWGIRVWNYKQSNFLKSDTAVIEYWTQYCSAWSRSQVQNQSFRPKQNTKLTVDQHMAMTPLFGYAMQKNALSVNQLTIIDQWFFFINEFCYCNLAMDTISKSYSIYSVCVAQPRTRILCTKLLLG